MIYSIVLSALVIVIALQGIIVGLYISDAVHGRGRHDSKDD